MSWNIEVDDEAHDAVIRAAQRTGLSVREWLEAAIQHEAAAGQSNAEGPAKQWTVLERRRQLAETAAELRARIRAQGPRSGARVREMEARLAGIEADLEATIGQSGVTPDIGRVSRASSRTDGLSSLPKDTGDTARRATEASVREDGLRRTLADLERRLAGLVRTQPQPSVHPEPTVDRIDPDLKRRIGKLMARTQQPAIGSLADTLAALEQRITAIRSDQATREEAAWRAEEDERTRRVEDQLRAVADELGAGEVGANPGHPDQDEFESAIADIAAEAQGQRWEKIGQAAPGASATVSDIERLSADIAALGRRVDEAANDDRLGREALSGRLAALPQADDILHEVRVGLEQLSRGRSDSGEEADLIGVLSGPGGLGALHSEMERIAAALDRQGDPASLTQLEGRMTELARLVEIALRAGREAAEASSDRLASDMAGLRRAIDDLAIDAPAPESIAFATLAANVADIREAIEGLAPSETSVDQAAITRLADDLAGIRETLAESASSTEGTGEFAQVGTRLDRLEATLSGPVTSRLEDLASGFERLLDLLADFDPGTATLAELEALRSDVASLRAELASHRPERLDGMEEQLSVLANRFEEASQPGATAEQLTELEERVAKLAADLSHSREQTAGFDQIETQLSRLQESLADGRAESIEAARAAALKALEGLEKTEPSGAFQADLDRLKEALGDARRETAEGRRVLDDTLADVSRRLDRIEQEGAGKTEQAVAEAVTPAGPVSASRKPELYPKSAGAPAVETQAKDHPFDRKLAALRELAATSSGEERPSTVRRADFIAAARRAAQSAAQDRDGLDTIGGDEPSPFARIGQAIRNRKKPLLLAAAAVVLALGVIKFLGDGSGQLQSVADSPPPPPTEFVMTDQERNPVRRPVETVFPGRDDTAALVAPPNAEAALAAANNAQPANPGSFRKPPAREAAQDSDRSFEAMGGPIESDAVEPVSLEVPAVGSAKLQAAARSGNPAAAFAIAGLLAKGEGVARDPMASAEWYHRAAGAGLAVAQYRLASLYERGVGVAVDHDKALIWYRQAAGQGHIGAMHNLAVLLSQADADSDAAAKSFAWFEKAASFGVADSQFNLGVIYARGIGVSANPVEAYKWFGIAAKQGDRDAARRRDEVGATLKPDQLATARAGISAWKPREPIAAANTVVVPDGGWGEPSTMASLDQKGLVRTIQSLLAEKGYDPGPADGVEGPKTKEAIKAFQKTLGVAATGQIDRVLVTALADTSR